MYFFFICYRVCKRVSRVGSGCIYLFYKVIELVKELVLELVLGVGVVLCRGVGVKGCGCVLIPITTF